ncbi:putative molybdenum cofactor sulfurase protein (HxB) [Aspergillus clavatus NRRL 1]|uniref:Molybdenum cofactor sulfurase n=1 Tax=Aspergillus clavatus (strain ATCC 1007 / CBS 513.65 / DSM 816 / NCTC 3887 / NRRL 1 / QM 1276 / 107) TaxID=344612 RepID=MOCOS_ASPCL|nr:molybdenum cofactor sulfurase protein (HxB), putative [Aspergillus clavatus NRRL 1]A1CHL0.1 RecName: Full=Molybdenum cofactor sulfurase; Short=MCS; Short=MOS; Short=MoCo sulfurase; AltName: Full=Molybdenum cofactor sulfurtransferase [Aspergillus clavatus NRRL 1]EAW10365.1 molybdenum cofactor sulfurase protein (HxB), putative [Aspergillus clavatus NRRL 1]
MVGVKTQGEDILEYGRGYSEDVDIIREREYPQLKDTTYLDHAGTTLYAKSLIEAFSRDLTSNLFGNPHSMSASSQLSTRRVDDVRLRALRFFKADPDDFDLVFVANATAAIKLVADAMRDSRQGFWYGYHVDAHTSLVGARELAAKGNRCFSSDEEVEGWIQSLREAGPESLNLFAYPAQSNLNGRRLPLSWCETIRRRSEAAGGNTYTLLDAASLVSTSPLDLSDAAAAPDFTVLSFYKIFGFPDLGALIVRKSAGHIFEQRRFFGGGTVDMVLTREMQWHAKKQSSIHDRLEDGTLPFHSIIALDSAFATHRRLFGSMENVSSHTRFLAKRLYDKLAALKHSNGERVCQLYTNPFSDYNKAASQGPIIAFNLRNSHGAWIGKSEVERLATVKNIQFRSGSLCNPGGTSGSLGWTGADLLQQFSAGLRCGDDHDVMDGRPTGVLRLSLGAMTNLADINTVIQFVEEFYVERAAAVESLITPVPSIPVQQPRFYIESLSVYPIKSCGAFRVPDGKRWEIRREGLAWDREWCLVHQGTGATLNQKKYPRMALIRPFVDLDRNVLRITCGELTSSDQQVLEVSLDREDTNLVSTSICQRSSKSSTVCGDQVVVQAYSSPSVSRFFSEFLGVPCTLARFPPQSSSRFSPPKRPSGAWKQYLRKFVMPGSFPQDSSPSSAPERNPILLSNESPILLISRSSVNYLNENIKANQKKKKRAEGSSSSRAVAADVFRANIVVAESFTQLPRVESPYVEDHWESLKIGPEHLQLDVLGACQRCSMVCIDQFTGVRRDEPFSTLAKTRKINGKIVFGRHASLASSEVTRDEHDTTERWTLMVGDTVTPSYTHEE